MSTVIKPDHAAGRQHFIFSQEHEDLRESMQAWVQKELWPHRNEWEDTYWPTSAMERAGELGYLGLCFPEEYGGQGGDYFYSLVRAECMSYSGSGGTNMGFAVQSDMVLPPIHLREEFGEDPDVDEVYDHVLRLMQETLDALASERRYPVVG